VRCRPVGSNYRAAWSRVLATGGATAISPTAVWPGNNNIDPSFMTSRLLPIERTSVFRWCGSIELYSPAISPPSPDQGAPSPQSPSSKAAGQGDGGRSQRNTDGASYQTDARDAMGSKPGPRSVMQLTQIWHNPFRIAQ
jgi:hypothetical protein